MADKIAPLAAEVVASLHHPGYEGRTGGINGISWSPDGTMLATGHGPSGAIRLWKVGAWRMLAELLPDPDWKSPGGIERLCFSSDGES
ncbi:MAG: hypothetical protein Q6373_010315, partial [Candidatus Sigynarchaeota archaeon]